ncbi:hypothetical protein PIB30_019202 [Stylosanthes scabra]|uniref:Calcium-transporting P-type ATPase N-terminal autoinhibitory domain-containing protein n=1 Tax=Stylosanthes scabra TaxID=79078 RepID=A0ABU6Q8S3_9FABA|nr:hypothetical protein [Stylosanthes scabra]
MMRFLTQLNKKGSFLWRLASVSSAVLGLICYALSSSFNHLFGKWNPYKITLYTLFSSITFLVAVLAKDWQRSSILTSIARKWQRFRIFRFRSVTTFLVMLLTTVFSFFSDRAAAGAAKPDVYSVVSSVAFSAMSLSLSRNVPFIFEELLYFFMGIFIAQMMKIKLLLGFFVGIVVSFLFVILHSLVHAHGVASLQASGENHAISNTAAAPSTVQRDENEGSPGPCVPIGNGLIDRLKRWRQAALVLNASRRFRYSLDLNKEEEREQIRRKIRNHAQVIRNAYLFKVSSERETIESLLTPSDDDDDKEEDEEEKEKEKR